MQKPSGFIIGHCPQTLETCQDCPIVCGRCYNLPAEHRLSMAQFGHYIQLQHGPRAMPFGLLLCEMLGTRSYVSAISIWISVDWIFQMVC